MKIDLLFLSVVLLPILSCNGTQQENMDRIASSKEAFKELLTTPFDIDRFGPELVQRTCALYVAIKSDSFEKVPSFDTDLHGTEIHWNMCSSGDMVACSAVPGANGDTIRTGIPWPYGTAKPL